MGTRWTTQSLHSASYPSSTSPRHIPLLLSSSASFSSSLPPSSFHPLSPPYFSSSHHPPPSPLSTSLSPAAVPVAVSAAVSASASGSDLVAASTSSSHNTILLNRDLSADLHLQPRSTSASPHQPRSPSHSTTSRQRPPLDKLVNGHLLPHAVTMAERPAIYVHFEFGVAWTPRHNPRNRQVTYMSKNMRDRAGQFPRHLPPSNTNYLTNSITYHQPPPQVQVQPYYQNHVPIHNSQQPHFPREVVVAAPPIQHQQQEEQPYPQNHQWQALNPQRTSRAQSRSSHERGSSAPPPLNSSPWDANPEHSCNNPVANNLPRDQRPTQEPEIWKALPATPNRFRLGEDGMPWSSWTFPMGYSDDDNEDADDQAYRRRSTPQFSEASPESARRTDPSDRDKGKVREMQSLAAALVTVDNGFEDQWWYQGPRLVNVGGSMLPTTAGTMTTANDLDDADGTIAWVASNQDQLNQQNRGYQEEDIVHASWASLHLNSPRSSLADIVSPVSDLSSPVSNYQGLHRSLTTRSDELHM